MIFNADNMFTDSKITLESGETAMLDNRSRQTVKIAFALGGLAGNNAHGAGFLHAACENDIRPDIISCTSGQIYWTYYFLEYIRASSNDRKNLRDRMVEDINKLQPSGRLETDLALLLMRGVPNKFRVPYSEYASEYVGRLLDALSGALNPKKNQSFLKSLLDAPPARTLEPLYPEELWTKMVNRFNEEKEIGVAFNAYDPVSATEIVYINPRLKEILGLTKEKVTEKNAAKAGYCGHNFEINLQYEDITYEGLRQALHLYQYGFVAEDAKSVSSKPIDGAYFRQIMLSELSPAETIYIARPTNVKWIDRLPQTYIELEDLKTEVMFNGSYDGERDKIEMVNKFLEKGLLKSDSGYHKIKLLDVPMSIQRGYFDYIFEKIEVFDLSWKEADKLFKANKQ
ncbi:hypothetical protein CCP2SC5_640016 [Azospirillaceae bacterium]